MKDALEGEDPGAGCCLCPLNALKNGEGEEMVEGACSGLFCLPSCVESVR